jgi:methionyl aminopeptidase
MKTMSSRRIEIKSPSELAVMREAGQIAGEILREVLAQAEPGKTTKDLDQLAEKLIRKRGAIPTFLGYRGYTATICSSINEEVVHGIPSRTRVLKDGDLLSIDLGVTWKGFVGDTAATIALGTVPSEAERLLRVTKAALDEGIKHAIVGDRLGDISSAIQKVGESNRFSVVKEYVGHGIGRQMHEEPAVPNYGEPSQGVRLVAGMALALEPMFVIGGEKVKTARRWLAGCDRRWKFLSTILSTPLL